MEFEHKRLTVWRTSSIVHAFISGGVDCVDDETGLAAIRRRRRRWSNDVHHRLRRVVSSIHVQGVHRHLHRGQYSVQRLSECSRL